MIPKVIHYCWFGGNEKSDIIKTCIESWRQHCPDYEIIEWNESNFDVNFCDYSKEAYQAKKWAFVSDVVRIKLIYEHGGIYMDTDVELRHSLDKLLEYDAWFAQDDIRYINTGLGFGACKGNELLNVILNQRISRPFDMTICNTIDTPIIRKYLDNLPQSQESRCIKNIYVVGMADYPKYARHWETNSWKDPATYEFQKSRVGKWWKLKCFLRNPTLINYLERNGETKLSKLYVLCAYDLLDNGAVYYIKRLMKKIFREKR